MKSIFTSSKPANRLNVNTQFRRRPFSYDDFSSYAPKSSVSGSTSVVVSSSKRSFWSFIVFFIAFVLSLFLFFSCGSPKTNIHVRNNAEGTATDISVQQGEGGSTSVVVSPSANLAIDSIRFKVR